MAIFKNRSGKARSYEVHGEILECSHCGHDHFFFRRAQLNTSWLTFFNLDWANKSASYFTCENCRHIMWFDT